MVAADNDRGRDLALLDQVVEHGPGLVFAMGADLATRPLADARLRPTQRGLALRLARQVPPRGEHALEHDGRQAALGARVEHARVGAREAPRVGRRVKAAQRADGGGVARDLAARGLGVLKPLAEAVIKGGFPSPIAVAIDADLKAKGCPHFAGRTIKGVKNGPSPDWLQQRLKAIGLRPISALVDVTNYFTFGLNRPLHVFDAGKVKGTLRIQAAAGGEEFLALDGKTYTLRPDGEGGIWVETETKPFLDVVALALGLKFLRTIPTGGNAYESQREQWDDANNLLCLNPGVVIGYDRNTHSTNPSFS
mgnify:CR=1 FL=1